MADLRGLLLGLLMVGGMAAAWQVRAAAGVDLGWPEPPPLLRQLSLAEGLPSSEAFDLAEDAAGQLWLATNAGLVRYDGHEFRRWQPAGLPRTAVETVLVDDADRLWFGLLEGGLARLQPDREQLQRWQRDDPPGWPSNDIWSLLLRSDGRLLVGTFEQGLLLLQPDSGAFEHLPLGQGVTVLAMQEDPQQRVWLATRSHGLLLLHLDGRVERVDLPGSAGSQMRALAWQHGVLWLGVAGQGLCRLRVDTLDKALDNGLDALDCTAWPQLAPASREVNALRLAPTGELWVARRDGLSWQHQDGSWRHLAARPGVLGSLPARSPWNLRFDSAGGLWIATLGGGYGYLSPLARAAQAWVAAPNEPGGLPEARVRAVAEAGDRLYVATLDSGLLVMDRGSGHFHRVDSQRIGGVHRVWDLLWSEQGLYVARDGGISLLQGDAGERHWPLDLPGGPGDGMPRGLLREDSGRLLVLVNGRGLYRLDPDTGWQAIHAEAGAPRSGEQMLHGPRAVWLASEHGLHWLEGDCDCLRRWPGLDERVHAVDIDPQGRWWLALADRLQLRAAGEQPGALLREVGWSGLPVGGIGSDDAGKLWIAGPGGLSVLAAEADHLRPLAGSLGEIAAEMSDLPFDRGTDGSFWLASDRGLLRIDPQQLPPAMLPRQLRIERLSVRRAGALVTLDASRPGRLSARDTDLGFEARAALPLEASALRYRSRVRGLETAWVEQEDGRRSIGVLPPGQYVLEVEARHPALAEGWLALDWSFAVAPPWWRQGPFLLLWLGLLGLAVFALHRLQRARLERRHQLALHRERAQWAEQSAAQTADFLSRLSHEIRNPLSGLLGLLRLAEADSPRPQQRERLALVRAAGQQISALVDDVLVWARGSRGQIELRPQALPLAAVVGEALARHRVQADARQLQLYARGDAAVSVQADRARLLQVLDNLLGNALKFTERGVIEVSWQANDAVVQLWVQDDGPGIPPQLRQCVFEAHRQLGADGRGLGLGLAIARELAQAMGGTLTVVDSRPGRSGACFELALPRAADGGLEESGTCAAATAASTAASIAALPPAAAASRRPWLLVEDDPIQRASLAHELGQAGVELTAVGQALDALGLLAADPSLGLLTDLGLPEVDGLSLIALVRQLHTEQQQRRPIVVLSARVLPADEAAARAAGADEVLHKPIEPAVLIAALARQDAVQAAAVQGTPGDDGCGAAG